MKKLKGFRQLYPTAALEQDFIFKKWRQAARSFAFERVDAPLIEPLELYEKKSGQEIERQLYAFEDKGGRRVTLRAEFTPSLTQILASGGGNFKKPIRWYQIGDFFRYERPQRGRWRQFAQFNADIVGEESISADLEVMALLLFCVGLFGLDAHDIELRVSSRNLWRGFLSERKINDEAGFLGIVDKMERASDDFLRENFAKYGVKLEDVRVFISGKEQLGSGELKLLRSLEAGLKAYGLADYFKLDMSVTRGLAYYTGVVFELRGRSGTEFEKMRALAGGGRYDNLCKMLGGADLPAVGFGMGDAVLLEFIKNKKEAVAQLDEFIAEATCGTYLIIADEEKRVEALGLASALRELGISTFLPLSKMKVGKQYARASEAGARYAILIGEEYPLVRVKDLRSREQNDLLIDDLKQFLAGKFTI